MSVQTDLDFIEEQKTELKGRAWNNTYAILALGILLAEAIRYHKKK